ALQVYGGALVQNNDYNDGDFSDPTAHDGDVYAATVADYIKIVTPADPSTMENKINAVFVLRQDTFTNNGETVKMDTAPYLDANNRTQLPIRYAAIACGVDEKDISWDQASQTATINGKNVVLRITIGSNIMQTSNGNITMDTAAVSSNGRIFVPIRYIANALGAEVGWDYDTKTITLTN
ncbi:MAG: copper amine oxidase N-terminal domain-containing protein, partial [Firmicutes bacterium]|nr:copper amine oxidase N-terminal domain-containing protein [Bacillota bacterium]